MVNKSKSRARKPYDAKKALAIKSAAAKYKVSDSYVRMCIAGTKDYGQADAIVKYYTEKYHELQSILK